MLIVITALFVSAAFSVAATIELLKELISERRLVTSVTEKVRSVRH